MLIKNAVYLDGSFNFQTGDLLINEHSGRIEKILATADDLPESAMEILDLEGELLIPGLIDIHTHGAVGMDSMSENLDLNKWRSYLLANGVTSFYPTTVTEGGRAIEESLARLADADGIYLEGPYLNIEKKGAHDGGKIVRAGLEFLEKISDKITFVALAPEFEENMELIPWLAEKGIRVCLGHSSADYDTAKRAFDLGASQLIHTFNAMNPLHHRKPGLVGAALDDERVFCEVVSDGIHLHPAIVRLLAGILGPKRMVLISDCMAATGLGDGSYELGELKITVKDGTARTADGAIAGSTKNLMQMLRSAVSFGVNFEQAVEMATLTPARAAGIDKDLGSIEEGKVANLLRVDEELNIKAVIYKGVLQDLG